MISQYPDYCLFCGKPKSDIHHLVFGTGLRRLADVDELYCSVCRDCHQQIHGNPMASKLSKVCGQLLFEKNEIEKGASADEARERFRKRYGRSYM